MKRDRGLGYDRVHFKPGVGACSCPVCSEIFERLRSGDEAVQGMRGTVPDGCEYVNRERVFAGGWEEENDDRNITGSVLATLFSHHVPLDPKRPDEQAVLFKGRGLTNRERVAAATAIQWLGSNVGWSFLMRCMDACGYRVTTAESYESRIRQFAEKRAESRVRELERALFSARGDALREANDAIDSGLMKARLDVERYQKAAAEAERARRVAEARLERHIAVSLGRFGTLEEDGDDDDFS